MTSDLGLHFFLRPVFVCLCWGFTAQSTQCVMLSALSLPNWAGLVLYALIQYCAHSFTWNWQLPFLNQQKGENDRRKYFMINIHEWMLPTWQGQTRNLLITSRMHIQLSHRGWPWGLSVSIFRVSTVIIPHTISRWHIVSRKISSYNCTCIYPKYWDTLPYLSRPSNKSMLLLVDVSRNCWISADTVDPAQMSHSADSDLVYTVCSCLPVPILMHSSRIGIFFFFPPKHTAIFLISPWKHMLWVLIRSTSPRCF